MEEYLNFGTAILMTIAIVMATIGLYRIIKDTFKQQIR